MDLTLTLTEAVNLNNVLFGTSNLRDLLAGNPGMDAWSEEFLATLYEADAQLLSQEFLVFTTPQ